MRAEIRAFLAEQGAETDLDEVTDDESLLDAGVIDSMVMVDLIGFLEEAYDITIDEDDMTPENFDTIRAIVTYVARVKARAE